MKKNHIEELNALFTRKAQEQAAITNQITSLTEQRGAEEQAKATALSSGDNAAYLEAHKRIADLDVQISGLRDLLEDKQKQSTRSEVIKALNDTVTDFESDRGKALVKYKEAKVALAKLYADACHAENELKQIRSDYMRMEGIDDYSGEVRNVNSFEHAHREALFFLKDELTAMGYDITAIMTGRQGF